MAKLRSPFDDVSDEQWTDAYDEACFRLGEKGETREPTEDEILKALDWLAERK